MEQENAGLGLNDNINETTLLSEEINNIDVHMLKNTEYGAIVLFGASDYGKQGNGANRYMHTGATSGTEVQASSTGNRYGVYELGYYIYTSGGSINNSTPEWVAGGTDKTLSSNLPNIDNRYIDRYEATNTKVGDATMETYGWHNSSSSWISNGYLFARGSVATFDYLSFAANSPSYTYHARASIVIGEGF